MTVSDSTPTPAIGRVESFRTYLKREYSSKTAGDIDPEAVTHLMNIMQSVEASKNGKLVTVIKNTKGQDRTITLNKRDLKQLGKTAAAVLQTRTGIDSAKVKEFSDSAAQTKIRVQAALKNEEVTQFDEVIKEKDYHEVAKSDPADAKFTETLSDVNKLLVQKVDEKDKIKKVNTIKRVALYVGVSVAAVAIVAGIGAATWGAFTAVLAVEAFGVAVFAAICACSVGLVVGGVLGSLIERVSERIDKAMGDKEKQATKNVEALQQFKTLIANKDGHFSQFLKEHPLKEVTVKTVTTLMNQYNKERNKVPLSEVSEPPIASAETDRNAEFGPKPR